MRQAADLVLNQKHVIRAEMGENLVRIVLRHAAVGAGIEDDAVFAPGVDLNDGVSRGAVRHAEKVRVHPLGAEHIPEKEAVLPDAARVADLCPGPGQGHRLVKALASRVAGDLQGGNGLPGPDKVPDLVAVVDIHRAEIKDHSFLPPLALTGSG